MESHATRLFRAFIDGWNSKDAAAIGPLFASNAIVIGFDGSLMTGRAEIQATLSGIFADHTPASYVPLVREESTLATGVEVTRADVGMIPPGGGAIMPQVNARQVATAIQEDGEWRLAMLQTTPAALHGRPELVEALTAELQAHVDAAH